jgi:bifunctional DNase/RNase
MNYLDFTVKGFVPDAESGQPILLLHDETGRFLLPIWIGVPEAGAIACVLQGQALPRPMTHDLLAAAIAALGGKVERVDVRGIDEGTFLADLCLRDANGDVRILDCRPSDAIALALRCDAPIRVAASVLEAAQPLTSEETADEAATAAETGLSVVSADDPEARARLSEALARLSPDAFGKFRT